MIRRAAAKARRFLEPSQHYRWIAKYVFPARNVVRWKRPFRLDTGEDSLLIGPEGAASLWAERHNIEKQIASVAALVQPGMTFVDVGAGPGAFSIAAARRLAKGAVFSTEASPEVYRQLSENLRLNAVGARALQVAFGSASAHGAGTTTTLNEFVAREGIAKVDMLRIDGRGMELAILRGADHLMRAVAAPLVCYSSFSSMTKLFRYHPVETMWLLQKYGYTFFVIDPRNGKIAAPLNNHAYDAMVIAVKPEHPAYPKVRELAN